MSKATMFKTGLKLVSKKRSKDKGPKPHEPGDNPFYYYDVLYDGVGHEKLDHKGRPKTKKRRKDKQYYVEQLGIPEADAKILLKMKKRAMLMDGGREVIGIRIPFGLSTVLTFCFPVAGDGIDFAISNLMVQRSSSISNGIGKKNYSLMSANVVQDFMIGLIPFAGAIIDMFYRANTRNSNLLEKLLIKRVEQLKLEQEKGETYNRHGYSSDENDELPQTLHRHDTRASGRGKQLHATKVQDTYAGHVEPDRGNPPNPKKVFASQLRGGEGQRGGPHQETRDHLKVHRGNQGSRFVSARDL